VDYSGRSDISVDSIERDPERTWLEQLRARGSRVVQVTYPRTANNPKELTVNRGEFLEVSIPSIFQKKNIPSCIF
jgi:epidermal growth factor receptor kinase substrate 8